MECCDGKETEPRCSYQLNREERISSDSNLETLVAGNDFKILARHGPLHEPSRRAGKLSRRNDRDGKRMWIKNMGLVLVSYFLNLPIFAIQQIRGV